MTMSDSLDAPCEAGWKAALAEEFAQPYFAQIKARLFADTQAGKVLYPQSSLIFNAFNLTPFDAVKVVILGQDPYHGAGNGAGQAMGLSFAVPSGTAIPPSLRNVYKELARTLPDFHPPQHGDLSAWAKQGVLLLNAALTVEAGKPASHSKIGWMQFSDAVIQTLSRQKSGLVFLLWGNFAKSKAPLIDAPRHTILTAVHPSPLAGGAFIGCNHFVLTNKQLRAQGETPIDWQV